MKTWVFAVLAIAGAIAPVCAHERREIEGASVGRILNALVQGKTEILAECSGVTRLVVAYRAKDAHVFLLIGEQPCAVITAPAEDVFKLILLVDGQHT